MDELDHADNEGLNLIWRYDKKVEEAKDVLRTYFNQNRHTVHYLKQIEIKFEKQFFHWIIAKAVNELLSEKFLKFEPAPLGRGTSVKFVFERRHRYYRRQIKEAMKIIKEYSNQRSRELVDDKQKFFSSMH